MKFSYLTTPAFVSPVIGQLIFHNGLNITKCMDLSGNVRAPGTSVDIFDCTGSVAQLWLPNLSQPAIHLFDNQTFCLDGGTSPQNGSALVINPCNVALASQRFIMTVNGDFIELGNTALCVGVLNDNAGNRLGLHLESCNPNDNGQVWHHGST